MALNNATTTRPLQNKHEHSVGINSGFVSGPHKALRCDKHTHTHMLKTAKQKQSKKSTHTHTHTRYT